MAKRRIAPWKWAVGIVVVVVGGGFGAVKYAEYSATQAAEAEASKLRKLGYPTTTAEFIARLPKDDADNAGTLYKQAFEQYELAGKPRDSFTDSKGQLDKAARQKFVGETGSIYQLLVQASTKPNCTFQRDWGKGFDVLFPELASMKTMTRIATARADEFSDAGDWRSALDSLHVAAVVAKHSTEPTLIGHLVAIACDAIVMKSFQGVLATHGRNPQFLSAARDWFNKLPPPADRTKALDFEIVGLRDGLNQLSDPKKFGMMGFESAGFEGFLIQSYLRMPAGRKRVEAIYLQRMREVLEVPYEDPWKDTARWAALDMKISTDQTLPGKVTSILFPVYSQLGQAFARAATNRRLTDVALWVAEERARNGTLPFQLLEQERFIDPWTTQRYIFIKQGDAYTVRSVGENGLDDGGPRSGGTRTDDVEVSIPPKK